MTNVLGIYGSPRKGGNTDTLLDEVLRGARSSGAGVEQLRVRDLTMVGCLECGGCDETGTCVVDDDMQFVYTLLAEADVIFLASPIFFYGLSAQVKALIDRCQAMWSRRNLQKTAEERKTHEGGRGYLIAVGATTGKNLFAGVELTARYFFDALDMSYEGGLFFRGIQGRDDICSRPEALREAFEFGARVASERTRSVVREGRDEA